MIEEEKSPLIVTRGDGVPLPDQRAAINAFKEACCKSLSAELRERIELEPLRYAQITQQFMSTVEYAATLIEERDHLTAQLARQQRVIERYRKDLARIEENDCPCGDIARAAIAEEPTP